MVNCAPYTRASVSSNSPMTSLRLFLAAAGSRRATTPLLPNFKHDPYGGLIALRSHMPSPGHDLDSACAYAEQELGCVPSGRLRTYVMLSAGAAMLQRVRDDAGVPLFIVKGGLIWQALLGSNARPTYDLDGALTCDINEFVARAREWPEAGLRRRDRRAHGPLRAA